MKRLKYLSGIAIIIILIIPQSVFAQDELVLSSTLIPAKDTVWVFTPADYGASSEAYPVVYMLHGYSGNYRQWANISTPQKFADEYGFVIVCPDGFYDSWYLDSPEEKDNQYASFFFEQLMPKINNQYNIDPQKAFITGLSMGGYGALHLFLTHPDKFVSAGSTSGAVNLRTISNNFGLPKLLGKQEDQPDRWNKYSVSGNLDKIAGSDKKIIFDCGWNGPFYKANENLRAECDMLGIDATFITQPGAHTHSYWKRSIPMHLFFFKGLLEKMSN